MPSDYGWALVRGSARQVAKPHRLQAWRRSLGPSSASLGRISGCGRLDLLQPDDPAFVSTVANTEPEDHAHVFHDEQEIRSLLSGNGFVVEVDQSLELAGAQGMTPGP